MFLQGIEPGYMQKVEFKIDTLSLPLPYTSGSNRLLT